MTAQQFSIKQLQLTSLLQLVGLDRNMVGLAYLEVMEFLRTSADSNQDHNKLVNRIGFSSSATKELCIVAWAKQGFIGDIPSYADALAIMGGN